MKKTKKKKKAKRTTLNARGHKVEKGGPIAQKKKKKPRLVAPAWQRKPRPWERGGPEAHHLPMTGEEFVSRCCILWAHGVTNKGIAYSLGVNFRHFSHWINELDRTYRFTVTLWGETQSVKTTFGELSFRMKETFEPIYLTKLKQVIVDAELQGDMKTVASSLKWLMEKTMPRKYGKHETLNIHNIPIAIKTAKADDISIEDI